MITKTTVGIKIAVACKLSEQITFEQYEQNIFTYSVSIENSNDFPVQLIARHWEIFDALHGNREVNGEGVVGTKPVLFQGAKYHYNSCCNIKGSYGYMQGYYIFENLKTGEVFQVEIPRFEMSTTQLLN